MPTQEIPAEDWERFFEVFSRRHEGWRVTIQVVDGETGPGLEAREMSLTSITANLKDRNYAILIILCQDGPKHLTRVVSQPKCIRLKHTEEGVDEALIIESANGMTTLLRLRSAVGTETLH